MEKEITHKITWIFEDREYEGTMTASFSDEECSVSFEDNERHHVFDNFIGSAEECESIVIDVKSLDYDVTNYELT